MATRPQMEEVAVGNQEMTVWVNEGMNDVMFVNQFAKKNQAAPIIELTIDKPHARSSSNISISLGISDIR